MSLSIRTIVLALFMAMAGCDLEVAGHASGSVAGHRVNVTFCNLTSCSGGTSPAHGHRHP